jgi:predicted deacylase
MALGLAASSAQAQVADLGAPTVTKLWDAEHLDYGPPALLDHARLMGRLDAAMKEGAGLYRIEQIGESVEKRSIDHLWFGSGARHVLLWSQMHGDEATATSALLDILHILALHRSDAPVERLLAKLTIHMVPMLNPDGAERRQRRNAQGIDINRDALLLQSPEGRALKALRDRLQPALGFNLHNEDWHTSAGKTMPAAISLLAVAGDEADTETPGRLLAKRTCAVIRQAVETLAPGQVARYDEDFEVRAFGDNITKWGTPVVLIETGPYAGDDADRNLVRLNVVAMLTALDALASGAVDSADAERYASLPPNKSFLYSVIIRNVSIVPGTGVAPFTGDIALDSSRVVREVDGGGGRQEVQAFRLADLGDMRVFAALEPMDATGPFAVACRDWKEGDIVEIQDWSAFRSWQPFAVGAVSDIALLRSDAPGRYTIVRIVPAERVLGVK